MLPPKHEIPSFYTTSVFLTEYTRLGYFIHDCLSILLTGEIATHEVKGSITESRVALLGLPVRKFPVVARSQ